MAEFPPVANPFSACGNIHPRSYSRSSDLSPASPFTWTGQFVRYFDKTEVSFGDDSEK